MPESKEMWLTPRANEPENDTGFVERNGDRGAHCFGSLADQVRGTLPMWPTPAVNDMGESKTPEQWDAWTEAMKERHANGNGHGASLSIEARRTPSSTCSADTGASPSPSRPLWPTPEGMGGGKTSRGGDRKDEMLLSGMVRSLEPSASPRSSPMPVPSSLIGGLMSPTSAPFRGCPASEFYASAVSSRLSSLVAFLASRTAPPGSDSPAPTTAISGMNASACFGSYVPDSPSLRTSEGSSVPNHLPRMVGSVKDFFSTEFCQTWPKAGTLANGKLYQQPTWERPTDGSASGSSALTSDGWPTASARDWKDTPGMALEGVNPDGSERLRLDQLARVVYEAERPGPPPLASGLLDPVKPSTSGSPAESWPSPRASDGSKATRTEQGARIEVERDKGPDLGAVVGARAGGKLNPAWVEALMGVPLGWTQLPRKFVKPKAGK